MAQYINKDRILVKLERIKKSIGSDRFLSEFENGCNQGKEDVCDDLRAFINTLEVKEVDISRDVSNWWNNHYTDIKKGYTFEGYSGHYMENSTIVSLAQYFFELGLKTKEE